MKDSLMEINDGSLTTNETATKNETDNVQELGPSKIESVSKNKTVRVSGEVVNKKSSLGDTLRK